MTLEEAFKKIPMQDTPKDDSKISQAKEPKKKKTPLAAEYQKIKWKYRDLMARLHSS